MEPHDIKELLAEIKMIRLALDDISHALSIVVDEGLTFYEHQDGPEELN